MVPNRDSSHFIVYQLSRQLISILSVDWDSFCVGHKTFHNDQACTVNLAQEHVQALIGADLVPLK
jgi:hypothetical protein